VITLYGYKKCGTCRKAEQKLKELGKDYDYVDITEAPPKAEMLQQVAEQAGVAPEKLFNTSGIQYRELNIKTKLPKLNHEQMFELLAGSGRLIKRPIVSDGKRATVGYLEQVFVKTWN